MLAVEGMGALCYAAPMSDAPAKRKPITHESLQSLRLFPLPEGVLFPNTVMPLHIFEPRYRAMVAEALEGDRIIAIAMLRPGFDEDDAGRPAIHDVVGVGRILEVQKVQDGRYYLALEGVCRARVVLEHPATKPFRTAVAKELEDRFPLEGAEGLRADLTTLQTAVLRLLTRMPESGEAFGDLLNRMDDPSVLSDVLCAAAVEDADARQAVLSNPDVRERLKVATDAVMDLILRSSENDQGPGGMMQ